MHTGAIRINMFVEQRWHSIQRKNKWKYKYTGFRVEVVLNKAIRRRNNGSSSNVSPQYVIVSPFPFSYWNCPLFLSIPLFVPSLYTSLSLSQPLAHSLIPREKKKSPHFFFAHSLRHIFISLFSTIIILACVLWFTNRSFCCCYRFCYYYCYYFGTLAFGFPLLFEASVARLTDILFVVVCCFTETFQLPQRENVCWTSNRKLSVKCESIHWMDETHTNANVKENERQRARLRTRFRAQAQPLIRYECMFALARSFARVCVCACLYNGILFMYGAFSSLRFHLILSAECFGSSSYQSFDSVLSTEQYFISGIRQMCMFRHIFGF